MCLALPSRCKFTEVFKKKFGRNVYALGIGSQKLKELKVTSIKDLTDIALLSSTIKSGLKSTFVVVGNFGGKNVRNYYYSYIYLAGKTP